MAAIRAGASLDPAPRQSEAAEIGPLNSLPIFIYCGAAERHYVTVRMQLPRIYCDKHGNISPPDVGLSERRANAADSAHQ